MSKKSIRFFNDREVRAVWDEEHSKWWFSATDIVRAINDEEDYKKCRNYWKYLKGKLSKDGNNRANAFLDWFVYSDNTIDGQSKKKAYALVESGLLETLKPGTVKALQQIHAYLFGGLYDFAGKIRTKTISKGNTIFCLAEFLHQNLKTIEQMPETTFDEIVDKYVEMNVAHPFMEGNGRSTRIWLDLIFKKQLKMCVDWSKINKKDYLDAMIASQMDSTRIRELLKQALTDRIDDREIFMKGIDYSYYYEQEE